MNQEPKGGEAKAPAQERFIYPLSRETLESLASSADGGHFHGKFVSMATQVYVAPKAVQTKDDLKLAIFHEDIANKARKDLKSDTENAVFDMSRDPITDGRPGIYDAGAFDIREGLVSVYGESTKFKRGDDDERRRTVDRFKAALPANFTLRSI